MAKAKQSCRTCHWYDKPKDKVARRGFVFRCLWEFPEVSLPDSITQSGGFRQPLRRYMEPHEGTTCPTWKERAT